MDMDERLREIYDMQGIEINCRPNSFNHIVKHLANLIVLYERSGEKELLERFENALEKYLELLDMNKYLREEHLNRDPFNDERNTVRCVLDYVDMLWEKNICEADVFKDQRHITA